MSVPSGCLIAVVAAAIFAFPIWFMVTSAFKAEAEVQAIPMHWFPHDFQGLAQFRQAAEIAPLWRYFLNSWIYAASHVGITVFFGALAGFGFAKYRFPGRTLLFVAVLSTIMVPFQVLVVPLFIEVKSFGWENSYPGLIIPGMMNAFGVFMMRQYASDLPDELLEAARVDGAGEFHIFLRIALPLLLPALASSRDHRVHLVVGEFPVAAGDRAGQGPQRAVGRHDQLQPALSARADVGRGHGGLDRRDDADRRTVRVLPAVFREGADGGGGEGG